MNGRSDLFLVDNFRAQEFCANLCTASGTNSVGVGTNVVISQTHWLVSQVRLARWRESLCLLYVQCCHLSGGGFVFTAGVSHHTMPSSGSCDILQSGDITPHSSPTRGAGLSGHFYVSTNFIIIFNIQKRACFSQFLWIH